MSEDWSVGGGGEGEGWSVGLEGVAVCVLGVVVDCG